MILTNIPPSKERIRICKKKSRDRSFLLGSMFLKDKQWNIYFSCAQTWQTVWRDFSPLFPSSGRCLRSNSNPRSESGVGSVSSACWTIYHPENSNPVRLDIQGHTQNYACFLRTIAHSCRFVLMLKFKRWGLPSAAVACVVGLHDQTIGQRLRLSHQWV